MGQELQLPDAFKGKGMAQAFQGHLSIQDDNLSDGIGQSYGVIGYKGKVWTMRHRGERKTIVRPDDGTPSAYLDVIILGQAPTKSKSFYPVYKDDSADRPTCSSMDSLVPDHDVVEKQSDSCALCPRNVWKTDPKSGRKGRECQDYKRLAVLVLPTLTKAAFGQPLMEPMFLRVPPDSLNSLAIMGDNMTAQGFHYASYVTRITFDDQKAHPSMLFRPLQPLGENEVPVVLEMRDNPTVGRITGGEVALPGLKAVAQALAPAGTVTGLTANVIPLASAPTPPALATATQPQPPAQQQAQTPAASSSAPAPGPADTGLLPAGAVPPATPTQTTSAQANGQTPGQVDTGFGGASGASVTQLQPQPGLQTVADVGEAEASDDELDLRIAGLIKG